MLCSNSSAVTPGINDKISSVFVEALTLKLLTTSSDIVSAEIKYKYSKTNPIADQII